MEGTEAGGAAQGQVPDHHGAGGERWEEEGGGSWCWCPLGEQLSEDTVGSKI